MKFREQIEKVCLKIQDMESEVANPEAAKDQTRYQKLMRELAGLKPVAGAYEAYLQLEREAEEAVKALQDSALDREMKTLYQDELKALEEKKLALESEIENMILRESDPDRNRDCIIEIRAGTGGEEAALFAANLFRMYSRYANAKKLAVEIMSSNDTGKGGLKEIIFGVSGNGSYPYFRYESGIHRVQRVPDTEASGRVHTSAVTVAVLPEAEETEVIVKPEDLKIDVYRASGAGGQHVNKTESAVRITHLPTGLVVSCQDERSQHKNKAKALKVLRAKLYDATLKKYQEGIAKQRKDQIGSGDRSGKIRTYNFPDQRVTDHRIGLTLHSLDDILEGYLDELVQALDREEKDRKLREVA